MNSNDKLNFPYGRVIDLPDHEREFCPGTVYFIDRGDNKMNEAVKGFAQEFEGCGSSNFMMFDYQIEILPESELRDSHSFDGISLVTAVMPCEARRQLFVYGMNGGDDAVRAISNFIYSADNYGAYVIKSKMLSLVMRNRSRVTDLFGGDENFISFMNPIDSTLCCRVSFLGDQETADMDLIEERSHFTNDLEFATRKFIEGDPRVEQLLYQRLSDIDPHFYARIMMKLMKDYGFEEFRNIIPYFVDYYMGEVETKTKVVVKPFSHQKGTDGVLRVVFKSDNSDVELPIHFTHKESAVVYIMLLKAHLDKKVGTLRELVERNGQAFKDIYKEVYNFGGDEAADAYKKVINRKTGESTLSRAESKLKLCKSDINAKVQELLKDYDNPFPFMIDGKKGRLYVPDEMIVLPEGIMRCEIK